MEKQFKINLFIVNFITLSRILFSPIIFYLVILGGFVNIFTAFLLFLLGAITDTFDGFLARKYGVQTKFGFTLDPIADKFLVLGTLLAFSFIDYLKIPIYFFLIVLIRDILVSVLKPISDRKDFPIPTTFLAKTKTTVQLVCIILIFLYLIVINYNSLQSFETIYKNFAYWAYFPYWVSLILVVVTIISGLEYVYLFVSGYLNTYRKLG
jgi:CDP-diacylglycerol--glycerol-3-phosphate 3-phosphatidyltransferase